jgi:transcriptional regulator with XRE-family HTH domain
VRYVTSYRYRAGMSGSEGAGDLEAIGLAVRRVRERAGMSEAEVEARAELREGSLASIECGETSPTWGTLRRIVYAIGISLPSLMEEVESVEADITAEGRG